MSEIIFAAPEDFPRVRAFYHSIIDEMQHLSTFPYWEKDVYPTDESLLGYIARRELRLIVIDGEIAAAAALGGKLDAKGEIRWPSNAKEGEHASVNMVAVLPRFARRGLAKELITHFQTLARAMGLRALRLDVTDNNLPAQRLYTKLGFQYVDEMTESYADGSSIRFFLYECIP
jgi:ribosomal protein S18 acetylase RimI-like enzyme